MVSTDIVGPVETIWKADLQWVLMLFSDRLAESLVCLMSISTNVHLKPCKLWCFAWHDRSSIAVFSASLAYAHLHTYIQFMTTKL